MATVLVLDFGGQYAQLIARRVRECRVYSELIPYDTPVEQIKARKPVGIILSGGPSSVNQEAAPMPDPAIFELGVPILGICYGLQLMAKLRGGEVARTESAEYGGRPLSITKPGHAVRRHPGGAGLLDEPRRLRGGDPRRVSA